MNNGRAFSSLGLGLGPGSSAAASGYGKLVVLANRLSTGDARMPKCRPAIWTMVSS
jgi:hypothetical protein